MLEVEVPRTTATRAAPWRSRAARTASMKPSAFRPSQARRLLRHSQAASGCGSGAVSTAATRPIQVGSGAGPKSFGVSALRLSRKAARSADLPAPAALVTV
jgi:hypothetical protein